MAFCGNCGAPLNDGARFCGVCGTPVNAPVEPAYEEPVYEEPVYQEPVYEQPVYDEPAFGQPAEEQFSYEPVQEEPVYQEPVYEEPVYEQPVYEEPVYEQPVYEQPSYEPVYSEPTYDGIEEEGTVSAGFGYHDAVNNESPKSDFRAYAPFDPETGAPVTPGCPEDNDPTVLPEKPSKRKKTKAAKEPKPPKEPKEKKSKKGLIIAIIIIVVLAAAVVVGYFFVLPNLGNNSGSRLISITQPAADHEAPEPTGTATGKPGEAEAPAPETSAPEIMGVNVHAFMAECFEGPTSYSGSYVRYAELSGDQFTISGEFEWASTEFDSVYEYSVENERFATGDTTMTLTVPSVALFLGVGGENAPTVFTTQEFVDIINSHNGLGLTLFIDENGNLLGGKLSS